MGEGGESVETKGGARESSLFFCWMRRRVEKRKSVMRKIGIRKEYLILPDGRRLEGRKQRRAEAQGGKRRLTLWPLPPVPRNLNRSIFQLKSCRSDGMKFSKIFVLEKEMGVLQEGRRVGR